MQRFGKGHGDKMSIKHDIFISKTVRKILNQGNYSMTPTPDKREMPDILHAYKTFDDDIQQTARNRHVEGLSEPYIRKASVKDPEGLDEAIACKGDRSLSDDFVAKYGFLPLDVIEEAARELLRITGEKMDRREQAFM